jgi:beta-aspartyl-peptidase (threonine type)
VSRVALAVHGGAGPLERGRRAPAEEAAVRRALAECLAAGQTALAAGASALDVVERAVARLEDDPHFNAGRGSALTIEGRVEMDASIMDGRSRAAGAVAGMTRVANPVAAARLVMERTPHVLLAGEAADRFARAHGARTVDPASLVTDERRRELERSATRRPLRRRRGARPRRSAVARDADGHLAAATSTGGLAGQLAGRVGDSAVIGAGTWADDASCAVSGTGASFIRWPSPTDRHAGPLLAHSPDAACAAARQGRRARARLHLVDSWAWRCASTPTMLRGWLDADGRARRDLRRRATPRHGSQSRPVLRCIRRRRSIRVERPLASPARSRRASSGARRAQTRSALRKRARRCLLAPVDASGEAQIEETGRGAVDLPARTRRGL